MSRAFVFVLSTFGTLCALSCSPEELEQVADDESSAQGRPAEEGDGGALDASSRQTRDAAPESRDASPRKDASAAEGRRGDAARDERAPESDARPDAGSPTAAESDADAAAPPLPMADGGMGASRPSAGCGKSGRPNGGRVSVQGDHNYTFPMSYDGQRPYPLLIGFHAAGNPIEQIENLTKGSAFEQSFVRAFPKSKGSAWDYKTDISKVRAMYDDLMANYCIDVDRVFATGHSSGAQLIVQVLTSGHEGDARHLRFKAVAPVAASRYGAVSRIPVLYIQGKSDSERRSNGSDVVAEFTAANACKATSSPSALGSACTSGGRAVHAGCIEYDGCAAPTVWCSHDDPAYSNTNHGWPCFATKAMFDFFTALP